MEPVLTQYLGVHVNDVEACKKANRVPFRYALGHGYIGLRPSIDEAMVRAVDKLSKISGKPVEKSEIVILQVNFSQAGFCHYALSFGGPNQYFQQCLTKMVYYTDKEKDWEVWHFHEELPLHSDDTRDGTPLIRTTWIQASNA